MLISAISALLSVRGESQENLLPIGFSFMCALLLSQNAAHAQSHSWLCNFALFISKCKYVLPQRYCLYKCGRKNLTRLCAAEKWLSPVCCWIHLHSSLYRHLLFFCLLLKLLVSAFWTFVMTQRVNLNNPRRSKQDLASEANDLIVLVGWPAHWPQAQLNVESHSWILHTLVSLVMIKQSDTEGMTAGRRSLKPAWRLTKLPYLTRCGREHVALSFGARTCCPVIFWQQPGAMKSVILLSAFIQRH